MPVDADGNVIGIGDIDAQIVKAFGNLRAILEEAAGTLDDVMKATCYLITYRG